MEINITTQWHRNKLRDEIELLSPIEKQELFIKLYCEHIDLKRLLGLFKCTMEHVTLLLSDKNIKRCSQCKSIKSRDQFWKHCTNVEKLYTKCIDCSLNDQRDPERQLDRQYKRKIKNQDPNIKLANSNYMKLRKQTDDFFRLRSNFSTRMANTLRKYTDGIIQKSNSCFELVGYNLKDLINHLESKFQPGMNWGNYGIWHIDHIIPISSFNITSLECSDFKECWSLDNLQPLWGEDNLKKSNKII